MFNPHHINKEGLSRNHQPSSRTDFFHIAPYAGPVHDYDPRVRYTCYFETASVNLFLAQNGVLNRYSFRNSYWYPFTVGSGPPTNSLGRQSSREQDRNRSSTQSAAVSRRLAVRKLSSFRYIPQPDTLWICWLAHGAWYLKTVT